MGCCGDKKGPIRVRKSPPKRPLKLTTEKAILVPSLDIEIQDVSTPDLWINGSTVLSGSGTDVMSCNNCPCSISVPFSTTTTPACCDLVPLPSVLSLFYSTGSCIEQVYIIGGYTSAFGDLISAYYGPSYIVGANCDVASTVYFECMRVNTSSPWFWQSTEGPFGNNHFGCNTLDCEPFNCYNGPEFFVSQITWDLTPKFELAAGTVCNPSNNIGIILYLSAPGVPTIPLFYTGNQAGWFAADNSASVTCDSFTGQYTLTAGTGNGVLTGPMYPFQQTCIIAGVTWTVQDWF